jgi:hypothetical protein
VKNARLSVCKRYLLLYQLISGDEIKVRRRRIEEEETGGSWVRWNGFGEGELTFLMFAGMGN